MKAAFFLRRNRLLWELLYRHPMAVTEIHVFPRCSGAPACPICPRCGRTMEREYMSFCSRCGQKLDWRQYEHARIIYVEPKQNGVHWENAVCPR